MKIVTSFAVLMELAHQLGQSEIQMKQNPSPENIERFNIAQKKHDDYVFAIKASSEMSLNMSIKDL